ncbi:MAG: hypothetical protein U0893_15450 [Chloroflexota bacterium]
MAYDLWDVESGNIVNTFETEREALTVVNTLLMLNGAGYAEALSLGYEGEDGSMQIVAEGVSLATRAASVSTSPAASLPSRPTS